MAIKKLLLVSGSMVLLVLTTVGCAKDSDSTADAESAYENTFYIAPNVEMSWDRKTDTRNLEEMKAALGEGGPYAKIGFMGITRYMNETHGAEQDFKFDPKKLNYILDLSKTQKIPVLVCLNGGPWGDVIHDPKTDLIEELEKEDTNCQWRDDGSVPDDSQGPVPGLMRTLSYRSNNIEVFEAWERNYKAAVKEIVEFKANNPELVLGITTDPELFMSPFYYTDYNPETIAEFRESMKKEFDGDLKAFNAKMQTKFLKWESVDPPRPAKNKGDAGSKKPFWEAWTDFRIGLVKKMVQREVDWAEEAGLSADMIYTHQTVRYDNKDWMRYVLCSTMDTAKVENGSVGITTLQDLCFDTKLFQDAKAASKNWGIFEYNPATEKDQSYERYMKALRTVYKYRPHVIAPYMWLAPGTEQFYAIKGTPFQDALRDFAIEVGKDPWSPDSEDVQS